MNIAIVDDDKYFLDLIKDKLLKYNHRLSIQCYQHPKDFIVNVDEVDYVLLDIELSGIDGISIAKQLRNNNISIFFITSHQELMIKAFGKNVEGFILKDDLDTGLIAFLKFVYDHENEFLKIIVDGCEVCIYFRDILYISYLLRDIEFYLTNNKKVVWKNQNLKDIIELLNDDFCLINRHTIVNIEYVEYLKNGNIYIRNKKLAVSRRKIKNIKIRLFERRLNNGHFT